MCNKAQCMSPCVVCMAKFVLKLKQATLLKKPGLIIWQVLEYKFFHTISLVQISLGTNILSKKKKNLYQYKFPG